MTTTTITVGGTTDVGQVREQNQDSILLGPVLFGVADGMGGHQGGEVASALAVEVIAEHLGAVDEPTTQDLRDAVVRANRAVYDRSGTDPAVAGMGTTIVGIAIVTDNGTERLAVINVGDSRAYRYHRGELSQVTDDHSLVGELLRDGRITAEEADVHPQRNVITRVLGIERDVVVDAFHFPAVPGDRYVLCSDGLTNEVPDVEIAATLREIDDPDDAARVLAHLANDNGGRDNITVVVVDVDGPERPEGLVPDADDFSHHDDSDTQAYTPLSDDELDEAFGRPAAPLDRLRDEDEDETDDDGPVAMSRRERRARRRAERERPRALTLRSFVFVALILALVGGGVYLVNDYATNTYYVSVDSEEVAIFKGRPGGFLWVQPTVVEHTGIDIDDVLPADVSSIEDGVVQSSLSRARTYVKNLRERIDKTTPPVTTTTTSPPVTRPDKTPTTVTVTTATGNTGG